MSSKERDCEFKLWGGRFSKRVDLCLAEINNSLRVDKRLYSEDIDGSIAYADTLLDSKLITLGEFELIKTGLENVRAEWDCGSIVFQDGDEDVHTVNERRLSEIIGASVGGKLHTGRSRNEQVVVDMKLWIKKAVNDLLSILINLIETIIKKALEHLDVIMPGYTHLQRAQPVRFSHWILSYAFFIQSDYERLAEFYKRLNSSPLGSGAIAGNPFNIDRLRLAKSLAFTDVSPNSMHAVGDRDFVVEFTFISSLASIHLSRLAEDLILYSTKEFNFIELSEEYTTGSSLMPQKRNPDSLELIRGVSGTIFGYYSGFIMTLKGLPSTYNKDFQNDKTAIFNVFDQIKLALSLTIGVVGGCKINEVKCLQALSYDMLATDLAYYLVRKGVAFREAHHIAGEVVAFSENSATPINEISLDNLKKISSHFESSVVKIWNFENSVEQYQVIGGTSRKSVMEQISKLQEFIDVHHLLLGK